MNSAAWILVLALLAGLSSCDDYNELELEQVSGEEADFSSYVSVGNSITAGYQSSALYESAQKHAFPKLLARQLQQADEFKQPLINDPGIGGRLGLVNLNPAVLEPTSGQGEPLNPTLSRPYNNLGIPGAVLADFNGADIGNNTYGLRRTNNPFYDIILREGFGNTQFQQLKQLDPTFITFWLGNNDVLGYVSSAGQNPYIPSNVFGGLFSRAMDSLATLDADVAVFNIPDVTSIPFVFQVNQTLLNDGTLGVNDDGYISLNASGDLFPLYIEVTDPNQPGTVVDTVRMRATNAGQNIPGAFFPLSAQSYLADALPNGIGITKDRPIVHEQVLDNGEIGKAIELVNAFNATIQNQASQKGYTVVDINTLFSDIVADGQVQIGEESFRPVAGELFSFDGVHPSNMGQVLLANHLIEKLNASYQANIPEVEPATIPMGLPTN